MFDVVNFSLASAVADAGTVTVGYPTGRSQGLYDWSPGKHVLFVNGNKYVAPADFSVTFNANASDITVTNKSGASWPAEATCRIQLDRPGADDKDIGALADTDRVRQVPAQLSLINLGSPDTADANGYVESQDLTSAGVFSVNTTVAATLAAAALDGVPDVPRNVVASWTGTAVLTVTGKDEHDNTIVESSASGTSFTGKKAFAEITNIAVSADVTSLTVGTGDVLGLPVALTHVGQILREFKNGAAVQGVGGQKVYLQDHMLEAAVDAGTSLEMVSPVAGRITKLTTVARGTITTGGEITVEVNTTAVDGLSVTVADAASAGDVDSDTPTAEHASAVVAVGDRIEIIPASEFNASADIFVVLEIEPTDATNGTFVAADNTEQSATTGDVRGTYAPAAACDGDDGYMLLVALPNPAHKGAA